MNAVPYVTGIASRNSSAASPIRSCSAARLSVAASDTASPCSKCAFVFDHSSRTIRALFELHAVDAGRARVAERERVQQVEPIGGPDRAHEPRDRRLVVEISPCRGIGQQQVVVHQPDERLVPSSSRPMRSATSRAVAAPTSEWSPGRPLPMSWSSALSSSTWHGPGGDVTSTPAPSGSVGSSSATHSATASSE